MLQFIFGRAVSGKTTELLQRVKKDALEDNRKVLLLVPEQSSFEYERSLLHILGEGHFTDVPVLSFTRMLDEVGRKCGGISGKSLTECGRIILMSRAMRSVADSLSVFQKYVSNNSFIESVIRIIDEFKRCSIDSNCLRDYAEKSKGVLSAKLYDLSLIYDAYDGIISGVYFDTCDAMKQLDSMLSQYAYFAEKTVYIDSFKNFTAAQNKILEHIIRTADNVVFSFCFDEKADSESGIFLNVCESVRKITEIAKKYSVEIEPPVILQDNYYSCSELSKLERCLSLGEREIFEDLAENITVCEADSLYDEAEFVANEIRRLVREEGYRYRDFVVICRDDEQYRRHIERMCEKYEIPCFKDKRHKIDHTPLPVFLLCAMKACRGYATEDVLRFLKTELADLSFEEVSELENYVYIWKIDRADWKKEWTMSPSGFDGFSEEDAEKLKSINGLRVRAIAPLEKLEYSFKNNAAAMSEALWHLMEKCGIKEKLPALSSDKNELELLSGAYDAVLEALDSISDTLSDSPCTPELYTEYFSIAISGAQVGTIPQMIDEITFGAADRIKPVDPRVVFVIGLNQGVFPKTAVTGGIIGETDRAKLLRLGMPLSDYSIGFSVDEEYILYTAVCCAKDKVYVCYPSVDAEGKEAKASAVIDTIKRTFPKCRSMHFGKESLLADRIETKDAAFTALMRNFENEASCTLRKAFSEYDEYKGKLDRVCMLRDKGEDKLYDGYGERLFGKNMYLSATAIDMYHTCAFSYFCKYGLRARALKPAEINVLQRGTIVHEVLEKTVSKYGKDICNLTNRQIFAETEEIVDAYLASIQGIEQVADARMDYIVSRIKKLASEVVLHLRDEFRQSGFEPVKCELKIGGDDADIEQAVLKTEKGSVTIRGAIDRVDTFGAYIRVVDYKTGKRKFALGDVLYGLNMQMLLYLYAALKSERFSKFHPAGVLYLEANSKVGDENPFSMNGIVNDNRDIVSAMEQDNEGRYIPQLKINKDGSLSKSNTSFINEELFYDTFMHMERLLGKMNSNLLEGNIPVNPRDAGSKDACAYCDYASVCGIENRKHDTVKRLKNDELQNIFKEGSADV